MKKTTFLITSLFILNCHPCGPKFWEEESSSSTQTSPDPIIIIKKIEGAGCLAFEETTSPLTRVVVKKLLSTKAVSIKK